MSRTSNLCELYYCFPTAESVPECLDKRVTAYVMRMTESTSTEVAPGRPHLTSDRRTITTVMSITVWSHALAD